jgi:hypothetical protein
LPEKEPEQVDPEDILHAFKQCDLRGDGLVHLGALKGILGEELVETLAEELETIADATGGRGQEGKGYPSSKLEPPLDSLQKADQPAPELPPEPRAFVQYDELVSWMFDDGAVKSVRCKEGHRVEINVDNNKACTMCAAEGTSHWCKMCCGVLRGYRLCFPCHQKALGKSVGFCGKWQNGNRAIDFIHDSKIVLSEGETCAMKFEDNDKCAYTRNESTFRGRLIDRGMKIKWEDGSLWNRSFSEAYIKQRSRVDLKDALKNIKVPTCGKCKKHENVYWSKSLKAY